MPTGDFFCPEEGTQGAGPNDRKNERATLRGRNARGTDHTEETESKGHEGGAENQTREAATKRDVPKKARPARRTGRRQPKGKKAGRPHAESPSPAIRAVTPCAVSARNGPASSLY